MANMCTWMNKKFTWCKSIYLVPSHFCFASEELNYQRYSGTIMCVYIYVCVFIYIILYIHIYF